MSIRRDPIYISNEAWRGLRIIAKAVSLPGPDGSVVEVTTPDGLADQFLMEAINSRWPQVVEHNKRVSGLERDLIKQLQQR